MTYVYLNAYLSNINILSNWLYMFGYSMNPNVTQKQSYFMGPGWAVQLLRASSRYAKLAGSNLHQGTYKHHPMNA